MKNRIALLSFLSIFMLFVCSGCKKELKDFSFTYIMESVDNYKLQISFDSDKTYRIEECNYSMANFEKKPNFNIKEGALTNEEYAIIKELLTRCNFFKMKDIYGFDNGENCNLGDIIYQISFVSEGKEKLISIRDSDTGQFSGSFVKLIGYINTFLNSHKNK